MVLLIEALLLVLLTYTTASVCYHLFLAVNYFFSKEQNLNGCARQHSFAIVIPAHNEELLIEKTCQNLSKIDYPPGKREIFLVADNCTDRTVEICARLPVTVWCRNDKERAGKGYALQWAFEQLDKHEFDAVLIVDADTTVETGILNELNTMLNAGSEVIQCYIKVPNRDESWLTQLIFVSRTINNLLYHFSKYKLGLSSYLMGSGMCFRTALLRELRWSAFSLAEDWEYFARIIERGKTVSFAVRAVVLQQESRSLRQATSQRLRWSKGRFDVVKDLGTRLLWQGIISRNWVMVDASLALLFPNWSLQVNLILFNLILSLMLPASSFKSVAVILCVGMLGSQGIIFLAGILLTGGCLRTVVAALMAPPFLLWKLTIDFVSLTGIYRGKEWIRTERHQPAERLKK